MLAKPHMSHSLHAAIIACCESFITGGVEARDLLHLLEGVQGQAGRGRISCHALQVQAILLQMARHILARHAFHIHQLQDGLRHSILHSLCNMPISN